jgi:hypothetical protein
VARHLLAIPILPENQTLIFLPKTDFATKFGIQVICKILWVFFFQIFGSLSLYLSLSLSLSHTHKDNRHKTTTTQLTKNNNEAKTTPITRKKQNKTG